jgi:hypothetical protein
LVGGLGEGAHISLKPQLLGGVPGVTLQRLFYRLRANRIPKIKAVDNYRIENNGSTTGFWKNSCCHARMARCRERKIRRGEFDG